VPVHQRLRLLTFPLRTSNGLSLAGQETSRFPYKERLHMPGSPTTPGRPGARAGAPIVLPSAIWNASAPGT